MSWRESYRQGSFRGARFLTETSDLAGGRRAVTHQYPERDLPWRQDLGRKARIYTLDCFVIGPDYMTARDALITALEAAGDGVLVHPFLGEFSVGVDDYRMQESTAEGGIARFSIDFGETGRSQAGEAPADPADAAKGVAKRTADAGSARFEGRFSVAGLPGYAVDGAAANVKRFADSAGNAGRLLGGAGKALRTFQSGLSIFDSATQLVLTPKRLADDVRAMVGRVRGLGQASLIRVRALRRMFDDGRSLPGPIGATPVRLREAENAVAFRELVMIHTAAEAVAETTNIVFASRDDAVGFRDGFAAQLDLAITEAADAGSDAHATALDALRLAMVRDVSTRGTRLDPLQSFTPLDTEPALVIAHRLFGPADIDARTAELVARNAIRHPGFVPGGIALEIVARGDG